MECQRKIRENIQWISGYKKYQNTEKPNKERIAIYFSHNVLINQVICMCLEASQAKEKDPLDIALKMGALQISRQKINKEVAGIN